MTEELPDLEMGELLYSENTGAYSGASCACFNGFPPARVMHVHQESAVTG
jgi:ornithine decarboxylase